MNTRTLSIAAIGVVIIAALGALSFYRMSPLNSSGVAPTEGNQVACTMEAKICPDGSAVGRSGPNCEFAACPAATSTPGEYHTGDTVTVTARIGQTVTALGERITPVAVTEDTRCPTDVQCIWAGTFYVKANVISGMGNGEITFELGKTATTEVNSITLESVAPESKSTQPIYLEDYVLTFKVTRR